MSIETKGGGRLGLYTELVDQINPNRVGLVSEIPLEVLRLEIHRREEELPFIRLVGQIIASAESKGMKISQERMVYELLHDCLGRPEMFVGYNVSDLTLEQILEEDEKIEHGQIPRTEAKHRIVWSERFVIYDPGIVRPYYKHTNNQDANEDNYVDSLRLFVDDFVEEIDSELQKTKQT